MATGPGASAGEGTAGSFEMRVSLPSDARFESTAEALVAHATQSSGHPQDRAERFARAVALAVRAFRAMHPADQFVPMVLRRRTGTLEVTVGDRTMTPEA